MSRILPAFSENGSDKKKLIFAIRTFNDLHVCLSVYINYPPQTLTYCHRQCQVKINKKKVFFLLPIQRFIGLMDAMKLKWNETFQLDLATLFGPLNHFILQILYDI